MRAATQHNPTESADLPREQPLVPGMTRDEHDRVRLDLAAYPHLPQPAVKTTTAADYAVLVPEMAA